MIKQNISKLLDTEMERKDFLKLLGIGVVAATGVTQIVKAVAQTNSRPVTSSTGPAGYGSMAYGGTKQSR